jgi:acyl-CoA thioesterase
MKGLDKFFEMDSFAQYLGIELLEASDGKAKARMEIQQHHINSHKTVHGGAIFALADTVFAIASNSYGTVAMAINVSISYFKAVTEGILTAEATEISRNQKLASYSITVTNENSDIIAIFQGMVYRKKDTIDFIHE